MRDNNGIYNAESSVILTLFNGSRFRYACLEMYGAIRDNTSRGCVINCTFLVGG